MLAHWSFPKGPLAANPLPLGCSAIVRLVGALLLEQNDEIINPPLLAVHLIDIGAQPLSGRSCLVLRNFLFVVSRYRASAGGCGRSARCDSENTEMATSTELQTRVVIVGGPSTTMLPEVARSRPLIVPDKHVHEHAT